MDRLERLVNLVAALIDTPSPLTRQQIHQRIEGYSDEPEAFRRNFERDKELLRQMGLPLTTEPLDPSHPDELGYRIPREEYELPDPGLDEDELAALRLASAAVQLDGAWGRNATVRALRKLAGAATGAPGPVRGDGPAVRRPPVKPVPPGEAGRGRPGGPAGRGHGRRRLRGHRRAPPGPVHLPSGGPGGGPLAAVVPAGPVVPGRPRPHPGRGAPVPAGSPGRPVARGGTAGRLRPAGPGAAGPPPPWRLGDEEEVRAELLVDAEQAQWALEALGAEAVASRRPDGSVVFAVAVTDVAAFRSFVLGFLDHAEILAPPSLRQRHGGVAGPPLSEPRQFAGGSLARGPGPSAEDRLGRLLAIVPWVATHDGPQVAEVCRRFEVEERELLDDLGLLFLCGVHPFTPDVLIDVDVADGRVWIRMADYFRRPLRLNPQEGLALVSAGSALLAVPGADPDGALATALAKLQDVLGIGAADGLDIELAQVTPAVLGAVRQADRCPPQG